MRINPRHLVLTGALATFAVTACGSDESTTATTETTSSVAPATTTLATTTVAATTTTSVDATTTPAADETTTPVDASTTTTIGGPMTLEVDAVDDQFQNLPTEITAGSTLGLTNTSAEEIHELVAVRLADEEQRPVADLLALPQPELDALVRGEPPPALVIVAQPGEQGAVIVGDGTLTEPGRYLVACFIPIGAPTAARSRRRKPTGKLLLRAARRTTRRACSPS